MPRILHALGALLLLTALVVSPGRAEKNLIRPPGVTRYADMVAQLNALADYDRSQGHNWMQTTSIGRSVKGRDIWMVTLHDPAPPARGTEGDSPSPDDGEGQGEVSKKLFYLCRQHGHEPAGTEGALSFITKLVKAAPDTSLDGYLQRVTVYIVPMANPDGAEAFLRHNAHDVDLNRDWLKRTQPETQAWYRTILAIRPDLMTDQHELYPNDKRWDFTETAGLKSGADPRVIEDCESTQSIVQGVMRAAGYATTMHQIDDHHPARLAHRYGCIVLGIPTILFETNRLTWLHRSVAERAAAHEEFMLTLLRDTAGDRNQLIAEAAAWQAAHDRNAMLLASRRKTYQRLPAKAAAPAPPAADQPGQEKATE